MALKEELLGILTQAKDEIVANMAAKGVNASGRTARGFAVEEYEEGLRIVLRHDETAQVECQPRGMGSVEVGTAPLSTLEIGREGGKVPKGFYYMIKQWTRDKGLQFATESERQTFSYFTAIKIAKEGTKRRTNPIDVYSEPAMKAAAKIKETIGREILVYIKELNTHTI